MVPRCLWARVEGLALWQCSLEESGWGRAQRLGQKKVSVVDEGSGAEPMWRTTLVSGSFSGHSDKQGQGVSCCLEDMVGSRTRPFTRLRGAALSEAHEGTAQSSPPDQAWRHLSLGSPAQQECAESLAPHFQICSWGWRVLETKPRGSSRKSQPCPPFPGRVILLCLLKGSADRLELSWQRSLQSSHPQQTFATTSLPRGVSRAWQPLGHIQLTARLGSPGRLCGSLSDLPQGLCRPGAWAPYGSLLCCTALPLSPPHLHPPGPPRL